MDVAEKYGLDLSYEHKAQCPKCAKAGRDKSHNNLHIYGEGKGAYCWSCEWTIPSDEHREAMGWTDDEEEDDYVVTRERITQEEYAQVKSYTRVSGQEWRGIRDETNKFFGVRYEYDTETGEPCAQYVPTTIDYKMAGFRVRRFPKDFSDPVGAVGKECDMIGEHLFQTSRHTCIIVGGETKMLNTYQMLKDNIAQKGKIESWEVPAVVCSTLGEGGAYKQVQARYTFFNQFQKIIICMDNDKAGKEAAEKIAKVLPKGRVYIMNMRYKDADDYVVNKEGEPVHKEHEFIQDFLRASSYVPAGVVGSGDLPAKMREEAALEKIPFPPFMVECNDMTAGGIPLGKIVNIGAGSGIGKTTWVDTLVEYWVFNSPHRVGVVSMELNAGQYGISMLSRYIGFKINSIRDAAEKVVWLEQDWVKEKERELFFRADGSHRFHLVDDRDGSIEALQEVVEQLVIGCGCRVIILDPLQDILDGLTNEEQSVFLKWQKGLIKSHGITFINNNHVRKRGSGGQQNSQGAMISEEDFAGSSTIFKSAALNILLTRNKMAEDPIERNTTKAYISKNRDNSITGPAGEFMYDVDTHQLSNKEDWLAKQPAVDFTKPTETDADTGEIRNKLKPNKAATQGA